MATFKITIIGRDGITTRYQKMLRSLANKENIEKMYGLPCLSVEEVTCV